MVEHAAGVAGLAKGEVPTFPLIGCCGWSESRANYFAHFQAIELQSTFYELPSLGLANKWRAAAPIEFVFCMKAWQVITHSAASPTYRKLKSKLSEAEHNLVGSFQATEQVQLAWERTAAVARAIEARVVLFQCPASFRAEPENVRNLQRFFSDVKRERFQMAWEPRGDWKPDLLASLCRDLRLLLCVDPLKANSSAVNAPYWRLHGRTGYSYRYADDDLEALMKLSQEDGETNGARYIFFNNIWMKDDALRFRRLTSGCETDC